MEPEALELVRQELKLYNMSLPEQPNIKPEIFLEEIAYGLRPQRHEGKIAPYGCLFRSLAGADPEGTRIDVHDLTFLRVASDGRRTFVVYRDLWSRFSCRREQSEVCACLKSGW